ncbi:MAG: baseplate J/gp47 family protein [Bacteroidota bacterium]
METRKTISNYLRKGTSQGYRQPAALDADYVKIEERSTQDFLNYAVEHSSLLNYFNQQGEVVSGRWKQFFEQDICILLAEFIVFDGAQTISLGSTEYSDLSFTLEQMTTEEEADIRNNVTTGSDLPESLQNPPDGYTVESLLDMAEEYNRVNNLILLVSADINQNSEASEFPDFKDELYNLEQNYERDSAGSDLAYPYLLETRYIRRIAEDYLEQTLNGAAQHNPQVALFIAFLKLMGEANNDLNALRDQHFDFYLRDVLRLSENGAEPDSTVVRIAAKDSGDAYLLASGTGLDAGKDEAGTARNYYTDEEITLTAATLSDYRSIRVDRDERSDGSLHGLRMLAESGLSLPDEEGIAPFGQIPEDHYGIDNALGFAISSPLLVLQGGEREIGLTFMLSPDFWSTFEERMAGLDPAGFLAGAFTAKITTADGWLDLPYTVSYDNLSPDPTNPLAFFFLSFQLSTGDPAIVAGITESDAGTYDTEQPILELRLTSSSAYRDAWFFLHDLKVNSVTLSVSASGLTDLELQNDLGSIDIGKDFLPFGAAPGTGANLYISCPEALGKPLNDLKFNLEWKDQPEDFGVLYENYISVDDQLTNEANSASTNPADVLSYSVVTGESDPPEDVFLAQVDLLDGGTWESLSDTDLKLFGDMSIVSVNDLPSSRKATFTSPGTYQPGAKEGFIRLQLSGPEEAFGHAWYAENHPEIVAHNSTQDAYTEANASIAEANSNLAAEDQIAYYTVQSKVDVPSAPYQPTLSQISLDYTSLVSIDLTEGSDYESWFQLHPFGIMEIEGEEGELSPIPQYEEDGYFYIGLSGFTPPQSVSLYLRMKAPATGDTGSVTWSGLAGDTWVELTLQKDETEGMCHNGIITLELPDTLTEDHHVLPSGQHWIRASVSESVENFPCITRIFPNAVRATFESRDSAHLLDGLAAGRITGLTERLPEVDSVEQPYTTNGGKPAEEDDAFRLRVVERLRHKGRAVSPWDYERLVLEAFPAIRKAKCIVPSRESYVPDAGSVYLVVVPRLGEEDSVQMLPPRASSDQLRDISSYLGGLTSPFVSLQVIRPSEVNVQVVCTVALSEGLDRAIYTRKLNAELQAYIYQWMFEGEDLPLGSTIENSLMVNHLLTLDYVDYVTELGFRQSSRLKEIDLADSPEIDLEPPNVYTIWTSVEEHDITMDEDAVRSGIDHLTIEGTFIIGGEAESSLGVGFWIIGESFKVWDSAEEAEVDRIQYMIIK